jgi:hypothetical protein
MTQHQQINPNPILLQSNGETQTNIEMHKFMKAEMDKHTHSPLCTSFNDLLPRLLSFSILLSDCCAHRCDEAWDVVMNFKILFHKMVRSACPLLPTLIIYSLIVQMLYSLFSLYGSIRPPKVPTLGLSSFTNLDLPTRLVYILITQWWWDNFAFTYF